MYVTDGVIGSVEQVIQATDKEELPYTCHSCVKVDKEPNQMEGFQLPLDPSNPVLNSTERNGIHISDGNLEANILLTVVHERELEIVENATKRGGNHLVSSDGFYFTIKSKTKGGNVTWVCTKKTSGCKARVIESNHCFVSKQEHTCSATTGAVQLAKIRAATYQNAIDKPFMSALEIVKQAITENVGNDRPFDLVKPQHLARNANRYRERKLQNK
ncbi:hypothetical protein HELRODRAFT_175974 [Helobdella robusta]|uniref:FLYWCH-type domain-containing protein n=1 Tax=Helobdella robusta TaxID=6412 RepID=T1F9Z5_HELRO|nr:hypothetical protein HELRODRAFT_175974 [Helobdella robusta]ESO00153.1 hypothetical protein HELRODRAFT_175974 [Helobdella robusta]